MTVVAGQLPWFYTVISISCFHNGHNEARKLCQIHCGSLCKEEDPKKKTRVAKAANLDCPVEKWHRTYTDQPSIVMQATAM